MKFAQRARSACLDSQGGPFWNDLAYLESTIAKYEGRNGNILEMVNYARVSLHTAKRFNPLVLDETRKGLENFIESMPNGIVAKKTKEELKSIDIPDDSEESIALRLVVNRLIQK